MMKLFAIGCGGFLGAIARYGLSGFVHKLSPSVTFPIGTMTVNLLGCFAIGILMCWVEMRQGLSPVLRDFLLIGFLGSMTTFSTFGYETLRLLQDGQMKWAMLNAVGSLVLGVGGVFLGWMLVKAIGAPGGSA
jgi:CrcB protein